MKLIWCSDIHLNFLTEIQRREFYSEIKAASGDAVIISGDIAESHNVIPFIKSMEDETDLPVYFVLGNHDFYGSSTADVKKLASKLNYLPKNDGVPLNEHTALVGVDGWGDCRYGDYDHSRLIMSDWLYIDDLRPGYVAGRDELKAALQKLADADAEKLRRQVEMAIGLMYTKIIIVTHVPPFEQASLHNGQKGGASGLPFFASKCLGDAILPLAVANPQIEFIWLSGHTHSRATYKPCDNMTVRVAAAEYYQPRIENILEI